MTSTRKTTDADVACIGEGETLRQAGHRMRELGMAVLPVCGEDGRLHGIITADMVVQSIAAGGDPKSVTVGEISRHAPVLSRAARRAAARPDPAGYGTGLRMGELAEMSR
jgi:CBS domain-containing protein